MFFLTLHIILPLCIILVLMLQDACDFMADVLYILVAINLYIILLMTVHYHRKRDIELFEQENVIVVEEEEPKSRSKESRLRMKNSFLKLGDVMAGRGANNIDVEEEEGSESVVLEEFTFQKYTDIDESAGVDCEDVQETMPFDEADPSFKIQCSDPYYSRDINKMQEEYPKVQRVLEFLRMVDPVKASRVASR